MINIRDALDFLERAKSSAENIERYAYDCDFGEARLVILELIAKIERLQDLIDKPPEEADWVADYHLLQSALDGPITDAARKWHAAYRKAQNSNLMRAKEVERMRSDDITKMSIRQIAAYLRDNRSMEDVIEKSMDEWSNFFELIKANIGATIEIERLRDLIDSPPEEADWLHDDARLCGEITTGVVQIARKWHSAYRKAQNSNLMRAKEIERLRSENDRAERAHESLDYMRRHEIASLNARIKELEALNESLMENGNDLRARCQRAEADNLMLAMWNKRYIGHIERLEAAFLEAERARCILNFASPLIAEQKAREALEQIRSSNHIVEANQMVLTTKQREAIELGLGEIGTAAFRNRGVDEFKEKKLLAADAVLRDLLSGSKPAWEVTEERTRALKNLALLHEPTFSPEIAVLRAMLDEAKP